MSRHRLKRLLMDMTEPELEVVMRECGDAIVHRATTLGVEKPLFVLLLFNDPALCQYIANCERAGMIQSLRETADRLENRETVERVKFPKEKP